MSIARHSATEIRSAGLHYTSTPREIAEALGQIGGAEAVGLWVLLVGNSKDYTVIKGVVCEKYGMSERAFTRCMRAMEKIELAWIEVTKRKADGTFGGKSWCVSTLPKSVQEKLDGAVSSAKSIAEDAMKNKDIPPTPSKMQGRPNDNENDSPTPSKLPTSAENRPSVNCRDITKKESSKPRSNLSKKKKGKTASSSKKSAPKSPPKNWVKPEPLQPDWRPSVEVMAQLAEIGIHRDFVEQNFTEFLNYWLQTGKAKMDWGEVLIDDMKRKMAYAQKQAAQDQSQSTKTRTIAQNLNDKGWAEAS